MLPGLQRTVANVELHFARAGQQSFKDWIRDSLSRGTRAARAWSKSGGEPVPELPPEKRADGIVIRDPVEAID